MKDRHSNRHFVFPSQNDFNLNEGVRMKSGSDHNDINEQKITND